MSSSDDDDLPTLQHIYFNDAPPKKTFEELFKENSNLFESLRSDQLYLEQTPAITIQETLYDDKSIPKDSLLDEDNDGDTFDESFVQLFGVINRLQFITLNDLTLVKCGIDSTLNLSETEKVLITLNENELHAVIEHCEKFSLNKFKQLKPFVQYVFKTMSIYPEEEYVRACQKLIKRTICMCHIKEFSLSFADVFKILFNYGVDIEKEVFNVLPGAKDAQRTETINEIPRNWVFNLKAVLSSIGDLLKHCKMKEEDLYNILIYLLWMSMDDFIKINSHLRQCTAIILCRFSNFEWPAWRFKIAQFIMSKFPLKTALRMIGCISSEEHRGFELRNYISYLALIKLTDDTLNSNAIPEYSKKLFRVKTLQPILESICGIRKSFQLVAIKFINHFVKSLKLSFKKEHQKLCVLLKRCENSISKHASIEQSQLCIIHSRISIMTPESMKQIQDDVSDEERDISIDSPETKSDAPLSLLNKLALCKEESSINFNFNDLSEKEKNNSRCIITNQKQNKEIIEDTPPYSLNEEIVDGSKIMKSICETSNDIKDDEVALKISVKNVAFDEERNIIKDSHEKENDARLSPLNEEVLCKDPEESSINFDSNDLLKKEKNKPEGTVTNQIQNKYIIEEALSCSLNEKIMDGYQIMKSVCETCNDIKDDEVALKISVKDEISNEERSMSINSPVKESEASLPSLNEQPLCKDSEKIVISSHSINLLEKRNINSKGIITKQRRSKEIFEDISLCLMNQQFMDDYQATKIVCDTSNVVKNDKVALEITEKNETRCSPEKISVDKLAVESQKLNTESDGEAETSSENENCEDREMELNCSRENLITPSKSFLIDHRYTRKKRSSSASPPKKLSIHTDLYQCESTPSKYFLIDHCYTRKTQNSSASPFKKLSTCVCLFQCEDQCEHKSVNSGIKEDRTINITKEEHLNEDSNTCQNIISCPKPPEIFEQCAENSFFNNINPLFNENGINSLNLQASYTDQEHPINIQREVISIEHQKKLESYQNSPVVQTLNVLEVPNIIERDSKIMKQDGNNTTDIFSKSVNNQLHEKLKILKNAVKTIIKAENPKTLVEAASSSVNYLQVPNVKESVGTSIQTSSDVNHVASTFVNKMEEIRNTLFDSGIHTSLKSANKIDGSIEVGSEIEEIITKIAQNSSTNNASTSLPDQLYFQDNNNDTYSKKHERELQAIDKNNHNFPGVVPVSQKNSCSNITAGVSEDSHPNTAIHSFPGIVPILPPSTMDICECSDANISDERKNICYNQNLVAVHNKNINCKFHPICTPSLARPDAISENCPSKIATGNLFPPLTISDTKSTDESEKVSSEDLSKTEHLVSCEIQERDSASLCTYRFDKNPKYNTEKLQSENCFIPRSVLLRTDKARVDQQSEKVSTPDFQMSLQNSTLEKNEISNTSEKDANMFSLKNKLNTKETEFVIPFSVLRENLSSHSVGNVIKNPNIVRINNSNNEEHQKLSMPSLNDIMDENQKRQINNNVKLTNKSVSGFNFDLDKTFVDQQNITGPLKQLSGVGDTSKIQPQSVKFQTALCSSPKRKHVNPISHIASKRVRLPKTLLSKKNLRNWDRNFLTSLPPIENLDIEKKSEQRPVDQLVNSSSSVYSTEICNLLLADKIPATNEKSDVNFVLSNDAESKTNSSVNLSSESSNDSESSNCGSSTSNPCETKKPNSQGVQKDVSELSKTFSSESDDDIKILEDFSNIKANAKKKFNDNLPSYTRDKRQKVASNNKMQSSQNSVQAKPTQSNSLGYVYLPENEPVSLFTLFQGEMNNKQKIDKEPSKLKSKTSKKSFKTKLRKEEKTVNSNQRTQKQYFNSSASCSNSSLIKNPRLNQTSLKTKTHRNASIPSSSKSQNPDDGSQSSTEDDSDCLIIEPDYDSPEVVTID